jgi:hypothetical protein
MIDRFRNLVKRLAALPGDEGLLYDVFGVGRIVAPDETIALLEARLSAPPTSLAIRLNELHIYACLQEELGRRRAGLSTANGAGLDDLMFKFARKELELLATKASNYIARFGLYEGAATLLAEALVSLGAIAEAEETFKILREHGGGIGSVTNFDPAFHAGLEAEATEALRLLPRVSLLRRGKASRRVIFSAADYLYFRRFGWDLVESYLAHKDPQTLLHLHVIDMEVSECREVLARLDSYSSLNWSLTTEQTGLRGGNQEAARGYYHAIRFARFWKLLGETDGAVWMLDIDALFKENAGGIFDCASGSDLALYLLPGRFEVRNKICACYAGASNTPAALAYLQRVSGYILHYWRAGRLKWGIDQVAMYAVIAGQVPPSVVAIPEHVSNAVLFAAKDRV